MKLKDVTPIHTNGNYSEKGNYQLVSILPNLTKAFDRCIYNQVA